MLRKNSTTSLILNSIYTPSDQTLYDILGVGLHATDDEIKKVYRKLILKYHPDKGGKETEGRFKEIQNAYEILRDPNLRRKYDESLKDKDSEQQFRKERWEAYEQNYQEKSLYDIISEMTDRVEEELRQRKNEKSNVSFSSFMLPESRKLSLSAGKRYYIVGEPIPITGFIKESFRMYISDSEIKNSFKKSGVVKVIEDKSFAFDYSMVTRKGDVQDNFSQSAIAHVELREDLTCETKLLTVFMNESIEIGNIIARESVRYFETDMLNLKILSAELIVRTRFGIKVYSPVEFSENFVDNAIDNDNQKEQPPRCLLM